MEGYRNCICVTCGTQYPETETPPERCAICEEERQYVPKTGQAWTSLEEMQSSCKNALRLVEPGLLGIGTEPSFAIGQRALLLLSPQGNILWDCISFLDEATVDVISAIGGLSAIAISHPHYYSSMVEWSRAFDNVPVYLHAADRKWVMRPDECIEYWEGDTRELRPGVTLVRCGGHFEGGTVLHWREGAGGRGALLSGDIVQVVPNPNLVSFMYSYPNLIPLPASKIRGIESALSPFAFETVYGAWWETVLKKNAKAVFEYSVQRYLKAIGED